MGEYVAGNIPIPDVDGWLNTLNDYASSAVSDAADMADKLSIFSAPYFYPDVKFDSITSNVGLGAVGKPTAPSLVVGERSLPTPPLISSPTISVGSVPEFTAVEQSLNIPAVPSPLDISIPVKNFTIDTSPDFPVSPDTTLPAVPTLLSLDLPVAEEILLPIFDITFPTSNSLVVPGVTFSWSEVAYSDDLLTKVKSELFSRLSGGTGLAPLVEEAIWNRGRDRESRAALLAERTLLEDRVGAGFSRPTGSMLSALDQIIQDTQGKIIELSREIMIKQAELEQENIKTSIQQTIALEDILIRENNNIAQRSFEAAKYIQDIAVEIFKISVSKYNSEVEAYKAFATAYSSRVQAELSKVEIFKAQIEAEKLKGDINEQNIKIYVARLEGIKSNVEVYKTLISAVSEKLKAESLKIDIYKTDIEAYSAGVKAKADEYSMYSEQLKGELAKVSIYESQVKAFTSRVQAYAAQSDVNLKKADAEINVQELNIKKYSADIEAFIKQVQADQLIYQAAVDLYRGETQMYLADVGMTRASAELALKQSENVITQNKYKADVGIQNAQISLESLKGAYGASLQAKIAAGSIYQGIGTSALNAINVSASLSGQAQIGLSENHNYSHSV